MTRKYEDENLILRLWYVLHRTRALLKMCEDQIYGEYNLTTEQYTVLVAIKHIGGTARISDIARWIGRRPNSVSMMVDRMVKAGLLKRVRDKRDRRAENVSITGKAEDSLKPAIRAGWEFIQKITSQLSNEKKHAFIKQHDALRYEIFRFLYPGAQLDKMVRNDDDSHANLMERLVQYALSPTRKVKHQGD